MAKAKARMAGIVTGIALGGITTLIGSRVYSVQAYEKGINLEVLQIVSDTAVKGTQYIGVWRPIDIKDHSSAYHFVSEFEGVNDTRPQAGSGVLVGELFKNQHGMDINFITQGTKRVFNPLGDGDEGKFRSNMFNIEVAGGIHERLEDNQEGIGQAVANMFTNLNPKHRVTWRLAPFIYAGILPIGDGLEFNSQEIMSRREVISILEPLLPKVSGEYTTQIEKSVDGSLIKRLPEGERLGWERFRLGLNPVGVEESIITPEQFYEFASSPVTRGEVLHLMSSILGVETEGKFPRWEYINDGVGVESTEEYKETIKDWDGFIGGFEDKAGLGFTSKSLGEIDIIKSGKIPYEYADGIYHFVSLGLMTGNTQGELRLEYPITRQDFMFVLYRMVFEGVR
jgi:hypothetical protein